MALSIENQARPTLPRYHERRFVFLNPDAEALRADDHESSEMFRSDHPNEFHNLHRHRELPSTNAPKPTRHWKASALHRFFYEKESVESSDKQHCRRNRKNKKTCHRDEDFDQLLFFFQWKVLIAHFHEPQYSTLQQNLQRGLVNEMSASLTLVLSYCLFYLGLS